MTEQTTEPRLPAPNFPEGHPLHAKPLTSEQRDGVLERLERQQRETREHAHQVETAWKSPKAQQIREVVEGDGNVEWPEFVKHCGGILKTVQLVDDNSEPDTDRIVPLIDELFAKHASQEFQGGVTFTRRPRNRPYEPRRVPSVRAQRGRFDGDGDPYPQPDPAPTRPQTHPR